MTRRILLADDGVASLSQLRPDFVITDVHMPGANGYEVCRRAKALRPEMPVLLLVGTFEPFDEAQSRAAGADAFLKKPFDSQELLHLVGRLLGASPEASPDAGAGEAEAFPPGPTAEAYPPGPTAQDFPPGPTAEAYPPGPSSPAASAGSPE